MIPIVGAELVTVPDGNGGEVPLLRVLATKLAERLHVPAEDIAGDNALHQVVCRYVQRGGRREDIYPRLRGLMKEISPPVPPLLRDLARIRHFQVFVTTTFDSLLAQALDEERFGGVARTTSLAYAPNHMQELRRTLAALPANAPYVAWGRWFLANRATRAIAPGFTITPAEADKLAGESASPTP